MSSSSTPPANNHGDFPLDAWQALMSGNWSSPPNRMPFPSATGFLQSTLSHITPDTPSSYLPIPALSLGYPGAGAGAGPRPSPAPGFGFPIASSSDDRADNPTSTSTPTSRPFSTFAGLARQQTQALAALHSAFRSNTHFAHLPNANLHHPRPPNANGVFDHLATTDLPLSPDLWQPPLFNPVLQHRVCEFHNALPRILCPADSVGPSPLPSTTPASRSSGFYLRAPDSELDGFDLRRNINDIPRDENDATADIVQGQQDQEDEQGRIAVDSLLDPNMPAVATSKKRNRAVASLDEIAGPATVKRPRSQSGGASVSSGKPIKPRKAVPTVVIPDSDDFLTIEDDDGTHEMLDLTESDTLPAVHKVVKEDTSTKLCKFECIICLDAASTLTVTHCGHMFCGPCLHQAMHAEVTKKICPMCRQKLDTRPKMAQPSKAAKTFFHLEMKLKLSKRQGKQPVRPMRRV